MCVLQDKSTWHANSELKKSDVRELGLTLCSAVYSLYGRTAAYYVGTGPTASLVCIL